ncbi:hypothetical protein BGZ61DRAFT_441274 [Ilyonectria robusta]|uniref:uncharacterized protein n=1 Tax=Ilyonectria robusta TaxID=1079257 RepID=UPI001E8D0EA1|nr:uncharacterized protein BGZ61DRAFT_441274 [Ilyonectria robusta]KAH8735953.1 hypothetical protein BGZ61DRAFT_441274 [Ilyonectria robusta]
MLLSSQLRSMWTDLHYRWLSDDPFANTSVSVNAGSFRWERHCILEVQRALGKLILLLFSALQTAMANQVSDRWLGLANSLNLESTQDTRMSLRIHHPCGAAHHLLVILRFCVWINAYTREFFLTEPEGSIPSSAIRGVDACYPFPQPTNQPRCQPAHLPESPVLRKRGICSKSFRFLDICRPGRNYPRWLRWPNR